MSAASQMLHMTQSEHAVHRQRPVNRIVSQNGLRASGFDNEFLFADARRHEDNAAGAGAIRFLH